MNTIVYIYVDSVGNKHESTVKIPETLLRRMGWTFVKEIVQGVLYEM